MAWLEQTCVSSPRTHTSISKWIVATRIIAKPRFLIAKRFASAGFVWRKNIYRGGPGNLKTSIKTMVLQAANKSSYPSSARYIEGKLFAITTKPRQVCSNTVCGHIPSNLTIFSIDHQAPLSNHAYLGAATGYIPASPLIAFRRRRNLRDLLVRVSLNATQNETPPGNHPCGAAGCKTCPILTTTDEFTSHKTGQKFKMKLTASCKSSNITVGANKKLP